MIGTLAKLRPNFTIQVIRKIIPDGCQSLLDIGCGTNSEVRHLKNHPMKKIGLEIFPAAIEESKKKKIHDEYVCGDAKEMDRLFPFKSIDCVISMDMVEHLEKKEALELIKKMENVAKKIMIIQTTSGFWPQREVDGNSFQIHRCGFSATEFRSMGYKVLGMNGPKFLRQESFESKRPNIFFSILANILDPIYRFFPEKSFNILAYKKFEATK